MLGSKSLSTVTGDEIAILANDTGGTVLGKFLDLKATIDDITQVMIPDVTE